LAWGFWYRDCLLLVLGSNSPPAHASRYNGRSFAHTLPKSRSVWTWMMWMRFLMLANDSRHEQSQQRRGIHHANQNIRVNQRPSRALSSHESMAPRWMIKAGAIAEENPGRSHDPPCQRKADLCSSHTCARGDDEKVEFPAALETQLTWLTVICSSSGPMSSVGRFLCPVAVSTSAPPIPCMPANNVQHYTSNPKTATRFSSCWFFLHVDADCGWEAESRRGCQHLATIQCTFATPLCPHHHRPSVLDTTFVALVRYLCVGFPSV